MPLRLGTATVADEALETIVRGAVASVSGARLDAPGRVARVLPGRRGPVADRSQTGARAGGRAVVDTGHVDDRAAAAALSPRRVVLGWALAVCLPGALTGLLHHHDLTGGD